MYSANVSEENQGALQGPLGGEMGCNKVVSLKMTSEGRVCLGLADVKRYTLAKKVAYVAKLNVAFWLMYCDVAYMAT